MIIGDTVRVSWAGKNVATTTVRQDYTFATRFTVPSAQPGKYQVQVTWANYGSQQYPYQTFLSQDFTITAPLLLCNCIQQTQVSGSWITPGNGFTFTSGTLPLSATVAGNIDHITFTGLWNGSWHTLKRIPYQTNGIYSFDWNGTDLTGAQATGKVTLSFDGYTKTGHQNSLAGFRIGTVATKQTSVNKPDLNDPQQSPSGQLKFKHLTPQQIKQLKGLNALIISLQHSRIDWKNLNKLNTAFLQAHDIHECIADVTEGIAQAQPVYVGDVAIPAPQFPPSTAEACSGAYQDIIDILKEFKGPPPAKTPIFFIA